MSNFIHPSLLQGCVATSKILSFREMKLLSLPSPPMWCFYRLFTVWIHWATQMRGVSSDRAGRCKSGSICENCVDHSPPKLGTTETWSLFSSSFDEWNVLLFVVFTWRNKRLSVFSTEFPLEDLSPASPLIRSTSSVTGAPAAPWGEFPPSAAVRRLIARLLLLHLLLLLIYPLLLLFLRQRGSNVLVGHQSWKNTDRNGGIFIWLYLYIIFTGIRWYGMLMFWVENCLLPVVPTPPNPSLHEVLTRLSSH